MRRATALAVAVCRLSRSI